MNALFQWLDVDRVQWRALVWASLRTDFDALRKSQAQTGSKRDPTLFLTVLLFVLAGLSPAVLAARSPDPLVGATMLTTVVAFMVTATLMAGEGVSIASPTDFHVLGFRPVTSRTYLAVRVTCLAVRTAIICTCIAIPPVSVYLLNGGPHPGLAAAAFAAAYASGVAVTLGLVAMYGWMLRVAGPQRLLRWASYTQLVAQMVIWGGFIFATQRIGRRALAGLSLSDNVWALAYPGTWFGSYVSLAAGRFTWITLLAAALSIAVLVAAGRSIGGKLSLGYADTLRRTSEGVAPRTQRAEGRAAPAWLRLLDDETRAVAILVRSHFRYDTRFRLGVISLIPLTIFYLYMGGFPSDPFVEQAPLAARMAGEPRGGGSGGGGEAFIQIALLFLPLTLRQVIVQSEAYEASWIFSATPADRAKLVLSARNIITLFFLVPYLLMLGAVFVWSFRNLGHAILHMIFTGLLSYLVLQFMVMMSPRLPFSVPPNKDTNAGMMFVTMLVVTLVGMGLYFLLRYVVYKSSPTVMVATAAAFLAGAWLMGRVTRRRAKRLSF